MDEQDALLKDIMRQVNNLGIGLDQVYDLEGVLLTFAALLVGNSNIDYPHIAHTVSVVSHMVRSELADKENRVD